jgi:hypothetical protein
VEEGGNGADERFRSEVGRKLWGIRQHAPAV